MTARAFTTLLVLALAVTAPPVHADVSARRPGLEATLKGDALVAYEESRTLFKAGKYDDALAALTRAQTLSPDPRLFWNMAACEAKRRRYAKALVLIEKYLASSGGLISDAERREANESAAAMRVFVGRVNVTSNAVGTQVFVDDELVGTTPFPRPFVVDQGSRSVRYVRSGYRAIRRTEAVPGGSEIVWAVELEREGETARSSPENRGPSRLGPILLGGGGVAVLGTGLALTIVSLNDASALKDDCGNACAPSRWEGARTMQTVGDVMIGVGAALVVGAAVYYLLQPSGREKREALIRFP